MRSVLTTKTPALRGFRALSRTRTGDRLLTMEVSPGCHVVPEERFVERFPCNSPDFSARCNLSSKNPEAPRKASNLSPKPRPKRAVIAARDRGWPRSAEAKAGR